MGGDETRCSQLHIHGGLILRFALIKYESINLGFLAMRRSFIAFFLPLMLIFALSPTTAADQADCSEELAIFDERIESGRYPDRNVQLALETRRVVEQMCSFLDDNTRRAMMDGLEDLLPIKSKEEKQAERRARSAEQKAIREAKKLAAAQAKRDQPMVSTVILAAPQAKPSNAQFIDRPEDMNTFWIWDWDTFDDKMRVLYTTSPSLPQLGRPDWQQYVYVVEMAASGVVRQHLVTSKQAQDHAALALRRGHDEIIFQRQAEKRGDPSTLERWSISGNKRISSVTTPAPLWIDGDYWDWQPFRLATSDGNILFSANKGSRDGTSAIAWFEASPDGEVLGRGSVSSSTDGIGALAWFHTDNGGGGLITQFQTSGDTGINSAITTPITRELAGRSLHAYIGWEKRLLVTSNDSASAWESPAIETAPMWTGDLALPADLSNNERMRQGKEQMEIMDSVGNDLNAGRSTNYLDVGPHRVQMIKPLDTGYGVLTTVSANRNIRPRVDGPYFLELDNKGIQKTTYLSTIADSLEVKFTTFAVSPNNELFLYGKPAGRDNAYVVMLNANREPIAYGQAEAHRWDVIRGMLADDTGVWLFGQAGAAGDIVRLWVERIDFP